MHPKLSIVKAAVLLVYCLSEMPVGAEGRDFPAALSLLNHIISESKEFGKSETIILITDHQDLMQWSFPAESAIMVTSTHSSSNCSVNLGPLLSDKKTILIYWLSRLNTFESCAAAAKDHFRQSAKYLLLLDLSLPRMEDLEDSLSRSILGMAQDLTVALPLSGSPGSYVLETFSSPVAPRHLQPVAAWNADSARFTTSAAVAVAGDDGVFPESVRRGLARSTIRVTTFDYPPKVYEAKSDGGRGSDEVVFVGGYEINLAKTLGEALGFVPSFRNPTDGGKWGGFTAETRNLSGPGEYTNTYVLPTNASRKKDTRR